MIIVLQNTSKRTTIYVFRIFRLIRVMNWSWHVDFHTHREHHMHFSFTLKVNLCKKMNRNCSLLPLTDGPSSLVEDPSTQMHRLTETNLWQCHFASGGGSVASGGASTSPSSYLTFHLTLHLPRQSSSCRGRDRTLLSSPTLTHPHSHTPTLSSSSTHCLYSLTQSNKEKEKGLEAAAAAHHHGSHLRADNSQEVGIEREEPSHPHHIWS